MLIETKASFVLEDICRRRLVEVICGSDISYISLTCMRRTWRYTSSFLYPWGLRVTKALAPYERCHYIILRSPKDMEQFVPALGHSISSEHFFYCFYSIFAVCSYDSRLHVIKQEEKILNDPAAIYRFNYFVVVIFLPPIYSLKWPPRSNGHHSGLSDCPSLIYQWFITSSS